MYLDPSFSDLQHGIHDVDPRTRNPHQSFSIPASDIHTQIHRSGQPTANDMIAYGELCNEYDPTDNGQWRLQQLVNGHKVLIELEMILGADKNSIQDAYHRLLAKQLIQQGDVILLLYHVQDRTTFEWVQAFTEKVLVPRPSKPIWLCAGRTHLPKEQWKVSTEEGEELSRRIGARFHEFSAQTNEGLGKSFVATMVKTLILSKILESTDVGEPSQDLRGNNGGNVNAAKERRLSLKSIRDRVATFLHKKN
ncbi:small G- Ras2 [Fusarium albosuccineum]|uniref:Small G- Ras2 n=1 Tax=Fusarium albosuccineum TaxID=1237068 RepID=A0A8H4LA47_9HYPO|nr:small G- Ras2 [Fusarium albosuccineum]